MRKWGRWFFFPAFSALVAFILMWVAQCVLCSHVLCVSLLRVKAANFTNLTEHRVLSVFNTFPPSSTASRFWQRKAMEGFPGYLGSSVEDWSGWVFCFVVNVWRLTSLKKWLHYCGCQKAENGHVFCTTVLSCRADVLGSSASLVSRSGLTPV